MKKNISLKLISKRYEVDHPPAAVSADTEPQLIELFTEATLTDEDGRITISYSEDEQSGMEGSLTSIIFDASQPDTLTMYRSGPAGTTMVFQPGLRHKCVYNTPVMPFTMTLYTYSLENRLMKDGTILISYITELAGSGYARTELRLEIHT